MKLVTLDPSLHHLRTDKRNGYDERLLDDLVATLATEDVAARPLPSAFKEREERQATALAHHVAETTSYREYWRCFCGWSMLHTR